MIETGIHPERILFFDIETVPQFDTMDEFAQTNPALHKAWLKNKEQPEDEFKKLGLYPEYSRIVCISAGLYDGKSLRLKSFTGEEVEILTQFTDMTSKLPAKISHISGHNIKEFDIPFIIKRATILRSPMPSFAKVYGKKPWEMNDILDTIDIWRCTGFKGWTSLEVLSIILNLQNPKEHIAEQSVHELYLDGKLDEIVKYCEADVATQANVYSIITGHGLL